ncbi:MAG: sigma 54-interacting transcriptional regulator [Planctomycetota bacterium]
MARIAGLATAALLTGFVPAQAVYRVPLLPEPINLDGRLDPAEWQSSLGFPLERREQVWMEETRGAWGGPGDLSANIRVAYDGAHLYLGGEVRDNSFVAQPQSARWEMGDAIEVFLNLDLTDDLPSTAGAAPQAFNADDIQIFLMPFHEQRPWGQVAWDRPIGQRSALTGSTLTGVKVAFATLASDRYSFEAQIPFHTLFGVDRPAPTRIGFGLALDDHDQGSARYQYMTLDGRNPVDDTRNLAVLEFAGPPPLADVPEDRNALWPRLRPWLSMLAGPAAAALVLWLLLRGWTSVTDRQPRMRHVGRWVAALAFVLGLAVPRVALDLRESARRERLDGVLDALRDGVPEMEKGTLGSYAGAQREQQLIELLRGRSIPRRRYFDYTELTDLAEGAFGYGPRRYPGEFFDVRPYFMPLQVGHPERIDFRRPVTAKRLIVVLSTPQPVLDFSEPATPRVQVQLEDSPGDTQPQVVELSFDGLRVSASAFDRDRRDLIYELVDLGAPLASVTLTALQGEDCQLVGLTAVEDDGVPPKPLDLGQAALTGIPVTLRGPYPEDSGIQLRGGERRVRLATRLGEGFDRAWLIYRAAHPGVLPDDLLTNATVGEVAVHFRRDDTPPRVVVLQHQRNVLFERSRNNQVQAPPAGSNADIAYSFKDEFGERHIDLVTEIELPRDKVVDAVTFRVSADYPIRFRAVVFGREREAAPSDSATSPLTRADQASAVLRDDFQRRLRGATFAIYRDGRLIEATAAGGAPDLVPEELGAGAVAVRGTRDGEGRVYESFLPLSGSGWRGNVLGVFVRDGDYQDFSRMAYSVGLGLCLLAVPVLLLMLAEAIAAFSSLRVRLVTALSVATLAPLAVLAWLVLRVVEEGHETQQRQHLVGTLDGVADQLATMQRDLSLSAETWLQALVEDANGRIGRGGTPDEVRAGLQQRMASQRPPDWKGGFLRLELTPAPTADALKPLSLFDGDPALRGLETPLRPEPSVFIAWGAPVLGVRREMEAEIGTVSLSAARPIDTALLARLAPQGNAVLCDVFGYPLAVAANGGVSEAWLQRMSCRASVMASRRGALTRSQANGQAVFAQHLVGGESWLAAYRVFRDVDETPRALLGVVDAARPASLPLPVGRVTVRGFLLAVAAVLLLFAISLSSVVTSRISKPIEQLARGAEALGHGDLDVRVEPTERDGHVARLTDAFNGMAHELRGRISDLRVLNVAMQELSSKLELREALGATVQLFMQHSPADRVRVFLRHAGSERLVVYGDEAPRLEIEPGVECVVDAAVGPFSARLAGRGPMAAAVGIGGEEDTVSRVFGAQTLSLIGFPLMVAGRGRGCVLLLFEQVAPPAVNLELLSALASQVALAMENARLYQAAVEDPYTGAYVPDYFRRRLARDVAAAQTHGQGVALLGIALLDGDAVRAGLGSERLARCLEAVTSGVRAAIAPAPVIGRWSASELRAVVVGATNADAASLVGDVTGLIGQLDLGLPSEWTPLRVGVVAATFPDEAVSAEFLLDLVHQRMAAAQASVVAAVPAPLDSEGALVASSSAMQQMLHTLHRVAPTDIPILIEGETGTGKELLADLAHAWSRRRKGPLVKVHCAALPESLLQSELFGYERGAFTGADSRKLGKFELARGGTVFLDEIGEIPLDVQVKLLRVLQQREIDRVGGLQPIPVDVRIVAATNRNLRDMVARGQFREDFYYRLQGMTLSVPPLRERRSEIPALVERFCAEARAAGDTRVRGFTTDALDVIYTHDWPGNVRELRNAVMRALVLASGEWVEPVHLDGLVSRAEPAPGPVGAAPVVTRLRPENEGIRDASGGPGLGKASPLAESGLGSFSAPAGQPVAWPSGSGDEPDDEGVASADPAAPERRKDDPRSSGRIPRLLGLLSERGEISVEDHVRDAHISPRTALRDLDELIRQGRVWRIGIRRGARYRLANS